MEDRIREEFSRNNFILEDDETAAKCKKFPHCIAVCFVVWFRWLCSVLNFDLRSLSYSNLKLVNVLELVCNNCFLFERLWRCGLGRCDIEKDDAFQVRGFVRFTGWSRRSSSPSGKSST